MNDDRNQLIRVSELPIYEEIQLLLPIWDSQGKDEIYTMMKAIWQQTGTPQDPVDWTEPDQWIPARLSGQDAELAMHTWQGSQGTINPRHLSGHYRFINHYELLQPDSKGIYRISDRGNAFLQEDAELLREIDENEGLPQLLTILASMTQAQRSDLLPEWGEFLQKYSNYGSTSTIMHTMRYRLANLQSRDYIRREGNSYIITQKGIDYTAKSEKVVQDAQSAILKSVNQHNQRQRKALLEKLQKMDPYRFEYLVHDLLDAMGYEDVKVTKASGDKGVDVVATLQFGFTTIQEVVQVKRHKASIRRPVLDQLRGSLPYFQAIRGTIITVGKFTKSCQEAANHPNAAPITLIDGEKLLDLLIKYGLGMEKQPAQLYKLDEAYFESHEVAAEGLENV